MITPICTPFMMESHTERPAAAVPQFTTILSSSVSSTSSCSSSSLSSDSTRRRQPRQVPQANLCRMGGTDHQQVLLGRPVLLPTKGEGSNLPGGLSVTGLQVDTHCISLLASRCGLRRIEVSQGFETKRIASSRFASQLKWLD